MGKSVTIIEKANLGGVFLKVGCIPSKALISASEKYGLMSHINEMGIEVDGVRLNF
jgi:dihydrolipoamide dehydrogenase